MRAYRQALIVLGSGFAAFLLLVGPINWSPSFGNPFTGDPSGDPTTSTPSDDPSDEPSDGSGDKRGCDTSPGMVVSDYLYERGFAKRNFIVGARVVDWSKVTKSHADQAFTWPLHTKAALEDFLEDDSASAAAARSIIGDDMVVAGDEWVAVQFLVPINYSGNWFWNGHKAIKGGNLTVPAGDIWWLNVSSDCEVEASDSVRAACGNVGLSRLRPAFAKID